MNHQNPFSQAVNILNNEKNPLFNCMIDGTFAQILYINCECVCQGRGLINLPKNHAEYFFL